MCIRDRCRWDSICPNHTTPCGDVIQMAFARSHGPRQPSLIVNVIEADSRLFRHSCLSHSTGTGGFRFSVTPQQPLQTSICVKTRRLDTSLGDDSIPFALILFPVCYTPANVPIHHYPMTFKGSDEFSRGLFQNNHPLHLMERWRGQWVEIDPT